MGLQQPPERRLRATREAGVHGWAYRLAHALPALLSRATPRPPDLEFYTPS
jgi:hypothetical protein